MGLFDKLKQGLKKTTQLLNTDIRDLFKAQGRLVDDAFLDELFETLVKTDMGVEAAAGDRRRDRHDVPRPRRRRWTRSSATIKEKLKALLAQPAEPIRFAAERADGHHGGRRQRLRQDDLDRQAGAACSRPTARRSCSARPTRSAPRPSSS